MVLVVLVLEQVDNVGNHRLVPVLLEPVLLGVLDTVPDQVDELFRLVSVEPWLVDHCSATMLNIGILESRMPVSSVARSQVDHSRL